MDTILTALVCSLGGVFFGWFLGDLLYWFFHERRKK